MTTVISSDDSIRLEDISSLVSKKIQASAFVIGVFGKSLEASRFERKEV